MNFCITRPDGSVRAKLSVFNICHQSYGFQMSGDAASTADWLELMRQGLAHLRHGGATDVSVRVIESPAIVDLPARMPEFGFTKKADRVEFRAPLAELPGDEGSPLKWSLMGIDDAIPLLKRVGEGDPDFDVENEDVDAILRGYFTDEKLTNGPECIQVGRVDGIVAALVIAQIDPKNGWSRLTYLGMLPEFRGRGLGKWIHRHGFAMMRAQGGTLYHGGTLAANSAMIGLFLSHGCKEYRRMQEWKCML